MTLETALRTLADEIEVISPRTRDRLAPKVAEALKAVPWMRLVTDDISACEICGGDFDAHAPSCPVQALHGGVQ